MKSDFKSNSRESSVISKRKQKSVQKQVDSKANASRIELIADSKDNGSNLRLRSEYKKESGSKLEGGKRLERGREAFDNASDTMGRDEFEGVRRDSDGPTRHRSLGADSYTHKNQTWIPEDSKDLPQSGTLAIFEIYKLADANCCLPSLNVVHTYVT